MAYANLHDHIQHGISKFEVTTNKYYYNLLLIKKPWTECVRSHLLRSNFTRLQSALVDKLRLLLSCLRGASEDPQRVTNFLNLEICERCLLDLRIPIVRDRSALLCVAQASINSRFGYEPASSLSIPILSPLLTFCLPSPICRPLRSSSPDWAVVICVYCFGLAFLLVVLVAFVLGRRANTVIRDQAALIKSSRVRASSLTSWVLSHFLAYASCDSATGQPVLVPRSMSSVTLPSTFESFLNFAALRLLLSTIRAADKPTKLYPLPACRAYLRDGTGDITSNEKRTLTNEFPEYEIEAYLQQRNGWNAHTLDSINWTAYQAAISALTTQVRTFVVKLSHDWLPVGIREHQ
jgi:hypothetical protein